MSDFVVFPEAAVFDGASVVRLRTMALRSWLIRHVETTVMPISCWNGLPRLNERQEQKMGCLLTLFDSRHVVFVPESLDDVLARLAIL